MKWRCKIIYNYLVADEVLLLLLILAAIFAATVESVFICKGLSVGVEGRVLTSRVSTFSTMLGDNGSGVLQPDDSEPP